MKITSLVVAAFCFLAAASRAHADIPWLKDLDLAKQEAAKQNKPLLIAFTGNWAPPSLKLMKLLATSEFEAPITGAYVPVQIDYSLGSTPKPEDKVAEELMETMKVDGIPTLIIATADGKETARLVGFDTDDMVRLWFTHKGDPEKVFQAELAAANSATGTEKLEKLNALASEVLAKLPVQNPLKDLFADSAAETEFAEKISSEDESVREPARAMLEKLGNEMRQGSAQAAWQLTQAFAAELKTATDEDPKIYPEVERNRLISLLADQGYAQGMMQWVRDRAHAVNSTGEFPDEAGTGDEENCRKWAAAGALPAKYLLGVYYQRNKDKGDPVQAEKLFREVIDQRAHATPSSAATASASPSTAEAITFDDLLTLLQAGSTSEELLTELTKRGYSGATDVTALTELKKAGATTALLLAIKKAAK